jgi:tetraacyldisaccharide 4'-kinase
VSLPFRFILKAREELFRSGFLRTSKLDHPVISVGNLTVGGTGKTPMVIALAERLRDDGWKPVVLSRGYKRSSRGPLIVSSGEGPIVQWDQAGDEPFLIARRVPGAAVVVGADRYEAGRLAERELLGNIFILDDGFQHRRLVRDFDLVMIDPAEWTAGERLLPLGRWREPQSALQRADAACVHESPNGDAPALPIPSFRVITQVQGVYRGSQPVPIEALRGGVLAFAGIAKPDRFFEALERLGIKIQQRLRFRDHHTFTKQDIESLGPGLKITTEKDAVRLENAGIDDVLHLRISATITESDRLIELIYKQCRLLLPPPAPS